MAGKDDLEYERKLVLRAKESPEAFGEIFDLYFERIFNYILRRSGNPDAASDITAETFMKALRGLPLFSWRGVPLASWLYRIAGNEMNMYFRRGRTSAISLTRMLEEGFDIAESVQSEKAMIEAMECEDVQINLVRAVLFSLPSKYQEALSLRYLENKKTVEVAKILGVKEGTARSRISRGGALLRERLVEAMQQNAEEGITEIGEPNHLSAFPKKI